MSQHNRILFAAYLSALVAFSAGTLRAEEEQKQDKQKTQPPSPADSAMTLKAGQEGTIFKSLRIEGEDRVRIEFERPPLHIDVDPHRAPGLDWEGIHAVLNRRGLDLVSPYMERTATGQPPFYARPWLDHFAVDNVARFRPALEGVDRWRLTVANSRGETVASFEGKGKPPKEIPWDGRAMDGKPVPPGLTYSYVLEAFDRAGNKRNFVGDGFELPAYRIHTREGVTMLFGGEALQQKRPVDHAGDMPAPGILLEAASWINQRPVASEPVRIEVTARTFDDAQRIADSIVQDMMPLLLGDPVRLQPVMNVQLDAPDQGTIVIAVSSVTAVSAKSED